MNADLINAYRVEHERDFNGARGVVSELGLGHGFSCELEALFCSCAYMVSSLKLL